MEIGNFGKIGVLMGGPSAEREISLKSGQAVFDALKNLGLEVDKIDIENDDHAQTAQIIRSRRINCAFLALHGRFGEDGQIQKILEELKIPYTGSGVKASKLAMDKVASLLMFESVRLSVPRFLAIDKNTYHNMEYSKVAKILGFPVVVKPAIQGSSIGLSIVKKEDELAEAVNKAFTFDERVIIEEYIKGRELTVGILDEAALPVIEIIPKKTFFDFEAKYQAGMTEYVVPAKLEDDIAKKVQNAALTAHRIVGCFGCSRVDIILSIQEIPYVLEINTIPGFTATSLLPKAAKSQGIEFAQLCLKLIKLAYEKA